jgi:hypothetical protein
LDEITAIPFYLIFNKKDVFDEEIQKEDISCCSPDCPNELKFDKNPFLKTPVSKNSLQKLESFELIKKSNLNLKVQDLSEDELFEIFSFLNPWELCEISKVSSMFYVASNMENLWMNLCLRSDPDLNMENVLEYSNNQDKFNIWKQYFVHFQILAKNSESYLKEKFLSVTNQNFQYLVTSALDDEFPDQIISILDDLLKKKQELVLKKEKGTKNLKTVKKITPDEIIKNQTQENFN